MGKVDWYLQSISISPHFLLYLTSFVDSAQQVNILFFVGYTPLVVILVLGFRKMAVF